MEEEPKQIEEQLRPMVEEIYLKMIELTEVKEALQILDRLPEGLSYHNKEHTLDVIRETILFALADGASEEVIKQQVISASWHDVGFVVKMRGNESDAVNMFEESNAWNSMNEKDREEVVGNILDTAITTDGEKPYFSHAMSKVRYVLDADVSNFGREDYFEKRLAVARELGLDLNDKNVKRKFFQFALDLLNHHHWETNSAERFRQAQKEKNIEKIETELKELED